MKNFISEKTEMKIYELLGVKIFRKMVFCLEHLIHHFDKGQNENYHIAVYEPSAINAFVKYLFYNGSIHARNSVILSAYILIKTVVTKSFRVYDGIILCLLVKDLYCVMLQRYNYLRINIYRQKLLAIRQRKVERLAVKIQPDAQGAYSASNAKEDLELIRKMREAIRNRDSLEVSADDIEKLNRIHAMLDAVNAGGGTADESQRS